MNANSKKLLSLVVAIALVLSMTPVISLQAEAAFDPTSTVCEHCGGEAVAWKDLAGTYTETEALTTGHYYLSASITVGTFKQGPLFTVAEGQEVCVNLNGYNITNGNNTNSTGQCFKVSGELAIMSEGSAGTTKNCVSGKTNNKSGENAGTVIANGGDVTIYGGRYENSRGKDRHAIYTRSGGTVTIKGGVFDRPVHASDTSDKLNIEGGQFNSSAPITNAGTANISGGTINAAITNTGTARVTGGIFNVTNPTDWLPNQTCYSVSPETPYTVSVDHTSETSTVTKPATCKETGIKTYTCTCGATRTEVIAKTDDHSYNPENGICTLCGAADPNHVVTKTPAQIKADVAAAIEAGKNNTTTCPICGATGISWTTGTAAAAARDAVNQHVWVAADATREKHNTLITVVEGYTTCLILEGNYTMTGNCAIAQVSGTLNIAGSGKLIGGGRSTIYVPEGADNAVINMYGGEISGGEAGVTVDSVQAHKNGGNVLLLGAADFNMYDGTIANGVARGAGNTVNDDTAGGFGGNVYIGSGATFTMHDGVISGGKASNATKRASGGGNIAINGGAFTMHDGEIYEGTTTGTSTSDTSDNNKATGGNIWVKAGTVTLNGGEVRDGVSSYQGGNIHVAGGSLSLAGDATVSGGEGTYSVFIGANKLTVDGAWTGSATVRYYIDGASIAIGETVPAANGVSTGAFTGTLLDDGTKTGYIDNGNGGLVLSAAAIVSGNAKEQTYTWYLTNQAAVNAYSSNTSYIRLSGTDAITLAEGKNYYVDNNGKAVTVTGTGTLYAMDSKGGGTWVNLTETGMNVVRDVTNPVDGTRYLTVGNQSYEFELKLTQVVLRAGTTSENMGLYYKATIDTSEELAELVSAYGAVFSLVNTPDDGFMNDTKSCYTMIDCTENHLAGGETTMTSGSIFGIMGEEFAYYTSEDLAKLDVDTTQEEADQLKAANKAMGEKPIFANAYIELDLNGDEIPEYVMASNSGRATHSLKSVMKAINDGMEEVPEVVKDFYDHWKDLGMSAWKDDLGKIAAAA